MDSTSLYFQTSQLTFTNQEAQLVTVSVRINIRHKCFAFSFCLASLPPVLFKFHHCLNIIKHSFLSVCLWLLLPSEGRDFIGLANPFFSTLHIYRPPTQRLATAPHLLPMYSPKHTNSQCSPLPQLCVQMVVQWYTKIRRENS